MSAYLFKNNQNSVDSASKWTIGNSENEDFTPLKNFLLKQAILFEQDGNNLYAGFHYGSLLLKVGSNGMIYSTTEPENDLLPDEEPENGRIYSLPDIGKHPICTLDLDVNGEYLYVLYSGKKVSDTGIFKRVFSIHDAIESIEHSHQVFKFNKNTGAFLEQLSLPIPAKKLEISGDYLYLLSFRNEDLPTIYKYPLSVMASANE